MMIPGEGRPYPSSGFYMWPRTREYWCEVCKKHGTTTHPKQKLCGSARCQREHERAKMRKRTAKKKGKT